MTHYYVWQGDRLISESYGTSTLEFFYDESGLPYAFYYYDSATTTNNGYYYYVTNLQGDIVGIRNSSGVSKATYKYNAWGEDIDTTAAVSNIETINPLRYRGYYYDSETKLYYLQSRYYDPVVCRFINADEFAATGQGFLGYNMFAYCANNPVVRVDDAGDFFNTIFGTIIGGVAAVIGRDENESVKDALVRGATTGFIAGAALDISIATAGAGAIVIAAAGGAVASAIDYLWEKRNTGDDVVVSEMLVSTFVGGVLNTAFFGMGREVTNMTGRTFSEVIKYMYSNTVGSVTNRAGKVIGKKLIIETANGFLSATTQAFFAKQYTNAITMAVMS